MDEVIRALLERHHGDMKGCIAWCLGYIDRLESQRNEVRKALGYAQETRLIDNLRDDT